MAGVKLAGTLVANAVLYDPVPLSPGWCTPSTVEVVVEVAHVLLTGLTLVNGAATVRDNWPMKRKMPRHTRAVKVPLSLHEAIAEAALQRDMLEYDKSESEGESEDDEGNGSEPPRP